MNRFWLGFAFLGCLFFSVNASLKLQIRDKYQEHYLEYIVEEFQSRGFVVDQDTNDWNVTWCIWYAPRRFLALNDWQRVNNMPAIKYLVGKDYLQKSLEKAQAKYGAENFPFWPKTFGLQDHQHFLELRKLYLDPTAPPPVYIIKRPALARGLGVHLVSSIEEVDQMQTPSSNCYPLEKTKPIAQEYIKDVLTIEGFKVTFRIYVAITSLDPLRIYVFPNGLGRICSRKYSVEGDSLKDTFVHIDSINLNEENEEEFVHAVQNSDLQFEGLRVDIKYMLQRLQSQGHDSKKLWDDIKNLIAMSIMSAEENMYYEFELLAKNNRQRRLYPWELVGYDVLVDKQMKPWLLEINNTPSMAPHTNLENVIKKSVLNNLFTLIDVENSQRENLYSKTEELWNFLKTIPKEAEFTSDSGKKFPREKIVTRDDVFAIVETEMEMSRSGNFEMVFPTPQSRNYLQFLTNKRNTLIVEWLEADMKIKNVEEFTNVKSEL